MHTVPSKKRQRWKQPLKSRLGEREAAHTRRRLKYTDIAIFNACIEILHELKLDVVRLERMIEIGRLSVEEVQRCSLVRRHGCENGMRKMSTRSNSNEGAPVSFSHPAGGGEA